MKEIEVYQNGTVCESSLLESNYTQIATIGDYTIVQTKEEVGNYIDNFPPYTYFVVGWGNGVAYPFDTPFYEGDEEEGIVEQKFPETYEDILSIVEGFGK